MIVLCWATTALMAASALVPSSVLAAVPLAAAVFLAPTANAVLFGYQAAITPDRLQGRVVSVIFLAATRPPPSPRDWPGCCWPGSRWP
ncbi:hypothetical protein V2I01_32935 [Micromonospora sp. BRA006-A]|nr:hypothetical protein [Micromonospora sp. BRA006-A]